MNPEPWKSLPPDLATDVTTAGPFWFSALKFEVITLNSSTMSEFGFTGVSQLQPGSETCAPSAVMSRELFGRPLYEKALFKGLWLPASPLALMPIVSPVKFALLDVPFWIPNPGMILMNSAALLPTET